MKKLTKISKIFLVVTMLFSQLSSVVTVLADEIMTKSLITSLTAVTDDELGYVEKYELTYTSEKKDYDEEKEYTVELQPIFTYLDEVPEIGDKITIAKTGAELNNENKYELNEVSSIYNGVFDLVITVKDEDAVVYKDKITYTVDTVKSGLVGALNSGEVEPINETLGEISTGEYNIDEAKEYTQNLVIIPGDLSPYSIYKVTKGEEELYKGVGSKIPELIINGSVTNTESLTSGTYNTSDTIVVEKLDNNGEVEYGMEYTYNSSLNYYSSDEELSQIYGLSFDNGYLYEDAINYNSSLEVSKISDLLDKLENTDLELKVYNENNKELDLTDEEVLNSEIKNNYKLEFTKTDIGTYTYLVVITGDNTGDNHFTKEDIEKTLKDYLEENKVLSMDVIGKSDEEKGTLNFHDIVYFNNALNNGSNDYIENTDLSLVFGEVPSEIVVGDTFELQVLVNSSNALDYINGINAKVTTDGSVLKLTNIKINDKLMSEVKDNSLIAVGTKIESDEVLLTLTFTAISKGTGEVSLSGELAKDTIDSVEEFTSITKEITVTRSLSSNNNLSSLKSSVGTFDIAFDKDVTVYTLTVPYDTESVILSGGLEDINSVVDGLIEYKLTEDKTVANITVTSESGEKKVYTVYIIKEAKPVVTPVVYYYSSNNYLKSLEIEGYEITFDKETLEYKIKVKSDVTSLDIKAIPESNKSRVEITGNEKFKKGNNTVTITVTAEDGSTREYKITVDKEAEKKDALTEIEDSSNTAEKIVIIILIILVVLGLLYLIFKKDDEEKIVSVEPKKDVTPKKETTKVQENNIKKNQTKKKK